ncbi:MAG: MscS Mechanosensitive ion channel [Pedosphaera sp.]|nr:MscS Mechanosensitive ion channel [Pedosphaera sp.]
MKLKFKPLFNGFLVFLLLVLFWSVWTTVAQETNSSASRLPAGLSQTHATNALSAAEADVMSDWVEDLARDFPFLKHVWWGNEVWKYLASLIYIFLAFYVSKFLDYLTRVWLKRWTEKTETKLDDLLLELLNGPIKIVVFVIFLHIGLNVFRWPDKVHEILSKGFKVVVAFTLTYMVLKLVDLLLGYWRQRAATEGDRTFDEQLFPIIRKSLKLFVVVVAVLVTAQNLDINVTAAITSLSIGGLAVGLAAQDTLANLFGAVAVLMDKPFRIGDRIRLDVVEGTVESIGLRSTRVRTGRGDLVAIPNKTVGNATITNISRQSNIPAELNLGLSYDTSAEKLRRALAILQEVYEAQPMIQNLMISFNKFQDSSLNIQLTFLWQDLNQIRYVAGMQELNLTVKQRFDAEGINFAFPTRTTVVKQG